MIIKTLKTLRTTNILILLVFIISACKEYTEEEKTMQKITKEWVYTEILINGQIMSPEHYGFNYMSMEFIEDGSFIVRRDEETETGEWKLDGTSLISAIGTPNESKVNIKRLTSDSLVVWAHLEQGEFEFIMLAKDYWESLRD